MLVHCLAGAHRAGTTGVLCILHYSDMDVKTAIKTAKSIRSVIDPADHLPELLVRYKKAKDEAAAEAAEAVIE